MLQWIFIISIFNIFDITYSYRRIYIVRVDNNKEIPVPSNIEVAPGTNLTLRCILASNQIITYPGLTWGRRTKEIPFHSEYDLYILLQGNNEHIFDLQNESDDLGLKSFTPIKDSDHGAYFCMSVKYKLFRVVHIKLRNSTSCSGDKFRCISNSVCIASHYQCDGLADCRDGSDEFVELCNGEPCEGKFRCSDGRCIPQDWCCDKHTDSFCTVSIRHPCCPVLPNPYDPLNWYNNQNITKDISKGSGPRYLFIAVCVVSAILSFVLFLFIISKVCGFDKKPQHVRDRNNHVNNETRIAVSSCGHSECAIRNELTTDSTCCIYHTEQVSDPLIMGNVCANNDRPPSYAEVVSAPPCMDKAMLEDLINAPPPPYSSTKDIASIQESACCDTNL